MNRVNHNSLLVSAIVIASLTGVAAAQGGTFIEVGPGRADCVSHDGSVVAGTGQDPTGTSGVYRWTPAGGMQVILPFGVSGVVPGGTDMSADGSVISHDVHSSTTSSGKYEAGYWTQPTGWIPLGGLPGQPGCDSFLSGAYAISDDGGTIVGLGWEGCKGRAFRWDASSGMTQLPANDPTRSQRANTVSGDGRIVGGWDTHFTGRRQAAVWLPGVNQPLLVIPPSANNVEQAGEVWGMNRDGTIIVGGESGGEAFKYDFVNGHQGLGGFPGSQGGDTGTAHAVTDDGSMIVGNSGSAFTGYGAFVWTEEDGMQKASDFLQDQKIAIPPGQPLTSLSDITPDGRFAVGYRGYFATIPGETGIYIRMPDGIRYGARIGGANSLDLTGSGSSQLGKNFVATTTNIASNVEVMTLTREADRFQALGGTFLVALPPQPTWVVIPANGGKASVSIAIPPAPQLIGFVFYLQSFAPDTSKPQGWAFSNGLKVRVRA